MTYGATDTERQLSLAEYECLTDDGDDRLELDGGWLVREPPPGAAHGWIQARLAHRLMAHVQENRLGLVLVETGVVLVQNPATVRGPDISFTRAERIEWQEPPEGFLRIPPDLVIEVISPSGTADQSYQKVVQYLDAGVRVVWGVHPRSRTVMEYRSRDVIRLLRQGDALHAEDILPGFVYALNELFAPLR